jgi:hypothetical protein
MKLAVLTTEYSPRSHADVIVSRWLEPRPTDALHGWEKPTTQIASLYVEQRGENDLAGGVSERHGVPIFSTLEDALTLGGTELAVDGILLIAEHGSYPFNALQQKLYPRKEMFDRVVEVFRKSGRVVPLFLDKHFSWNPRWANEMYWTIRDRGIPFFGGSSMPFSPFVSAGPLPPPGPELVAIYFNEVESYLFHSLAVVSARLADCPHHTDVTEIVAWSGEDVWSALDRGEFSAELLEAAARAVSADAAHNLRHFREQRGGPVYAFQLHYASGLKTTHFMQKDVIRKWTLAWRSAEGAIRSGYVDPGTRADFHPSFARFNRQIEDFMRTSQSPVPLNRLYLETMQTAACMTALHQPGVPLATPWLALPIERNPNLHHD